MEGKKQGGAQESKSYWVSLAGAAATKLRSVAPDPTAVKGACGALSGYAYRALVTVKGAINVPMEASRNRISSWASQSQSKEVILKVVTSAAADEALKAVSVFVPGGDPLYRITKAGASELSKAYSKKGAEQLKNEDAAGAEGLAGSSSLETIQKKLQEMSSKMNELKLQNQMLREKVSGLSKAYSMKGAGASELSKTYSKKGAEQPNKDAASAEGPVGSLSLETIEKKLQEMSSEMNKLKLQNQMLREKASGLSVVNHPSLRLSTPSQQLPRPASEAALARPKPKV